MDTKRYDCVSGALIFCAVCSLYILTISSGYHYDSMTLAQLAERGKLFVFYLRHHALLIFLNALFYSIWSFFSPNKSALFPLAVLSAFIGALGVTMFFYTLKNLFSNRLLAIFGALGLAFSFNYWRYSTLAETHILPASLLICAFYFLTALSKERPRRNVIISGVFVSLSLFSSGAYIVFLPALFVFLWNSVISKKKRIIFIELYLITIVLFWFIPYFILGFAVFLKNILIKGYVYGFKETVEFFFLWFKSELYFTYFKPGYLLIMAKRNADSIFYGGNLLSYIVIYAAIFTGYIFMRKKISLNYPNIMRCLLVAAFLFFGTIIFYEPFNLQRYTPFLIFLWLFIALILSQFSYKGKSLRYFIVLFFILCGIFVNNFLRSIVPGMNPKNNLYLRTALLVRNNTEERDLVIARGGDLWLNKAIWPSTTVKYIAYFSPRNIIELRYLQAALIHSDKKTVLSKFKDEIRDAISEGKKVLVLSDVLELEKSKGAYPEFYFDLTELLIKDYSVSKFLEDDGVVIYELRNKII